MQQAYANTCVLMGSLSAIFVFVRCGVKYKFGTFLAALSMAAQMWCPYGCGALFCFSASSWTEEGLNTERVDGCSLTHALCYLGELVDTNKSQYLHAMEVVSNSYEGGHIRTFSPQSLAIRMGS